LKLYFDGSCGPKNPGGYACYAFVIKNENVEVTRKTGVECEGESATNNVAEYAGLLHGLEYIIENNITDNIEIFGDSQLVINQINGTWKCKQKHLQVILANVHTKLQQLTSWKATWIPREYNALADGLSKWDSVING
jgi:ribonuclease HI